MICEVVNIFNPDEIRLVYCNNITSGITIFLDITGKELYNRDSETVFTTDDSKYTIRRFKP